MNASDDNRIQSSGNWPKNTPGYNEARYIEFIFSPTVPANNTVLNVSITHEYRRSGTLTGAKLEVWDGSVWHNETLTLPPASNSDFGETKDVSAYINTAAKTNGIKARFLAYRNNNGDIKTSHDFIKVTATYTNPDITAPVITLTGATPVTVAVGDSYADAGATALDNIDGDITANIITVNPVNTAVVGSYTVTYNVSDAAGNAAIPVTRAVNVTDTISPVVTVTGANPQIIEVGTAYTELGATVADNYDTGLVATINSSAVNMAVVGSYTVTYDVVDSSGNNAAQVTRAVNVVDTTAPVITMLGSSPVTVLVHTSYTDDGATASDNYNGDLTSSIAAVSTVDVDVVGGYTVKYNISDANGNVAVQVTRNVNIVDTTAPIINLVGNNPQTIEVGTAYSELGATVTDDYDTGMVATINATAVDTAVVGSYTVTYDATDTNGNVATQVTRTVNVVDTTAPVITLNGATPIDVAVGDVYVDDGAAALDNYDGDITDNIETVNPVNTAVVGTYTVTYNVSDESDNAASEVTRTVNVIDTIDPVITLVGANPQTIEMGTAYSELGATVTDNYDLGLSATINSSSVDTNTVGSYTVTYDVTDANGNAATEETRTVNVVDTTAPVITVDPYTTAQTNTDIIVSVSTNEGTLNASSHLFSENGSFDFVATDAVGNVATKTVTITNIDRVSPVITRLSINPFNLTTGDSYTDPGATAADNADGDITSSIVTVNPVNTAHEGTYTITYNVTDAAGNVATEVTRTVIVTKPVVTGPSGATPDIIPPTPVPPTPIINTATISPPAGSVLGEKITLLDELIASLKPFKHNSKVKQLQQELKKLGLFKFPYFTDYWGPITNAGVKKYLSTK